MVEVEQLPDDHEIGQQRTRYPWKTWTNGGKYIARKGKHFTCTTASFQMQLYTKAQRMGLTVRASRVGDDIEFQFSQVQELAKAS